MEFSDIRKLNLSDYENYDIVAAVLIPYSTSVDEIDRYALEDNPELFSQEEITFILGKIEKGEWDSKEVEITTSPYSIYQTLRYHFGPEKVLSSDPIDGYIYGLKAGGCYFFVVYGLYDTETVILEVAGPANLLDDAITQFRETLGKETTRLKRADFIKEPDYSVLFQNPFHTYFKQALEILEKNQKAVQLWQEYRQSKHTSERPSVSEKEEYLLPAFFLFQASFEGFLNLIYELYLDSAYRNDDRIREQLKRAEIDIKLRLAPAYCSCFKNRIIAKEEIFEKFHAIVNLRNEFVHANLTSGMLSNVKVEDGITFLFPSKASTKESKHSLPANPSDFKLSHLEFVCETTEKMVDLVLSFMKERHKRELSRVLHQDSFIASFVDGEYIIDSEEQ